MPRQITRTGTYQELDFLLIIGMLRQHHEISKKIMKHFSYTVYLVYSSNKTAVMTSQNSTSALTEQTVQALSGSATAVSPTDGASLINNWISALGQSSPISSGLTSLKNALQSGSPDSDEISSILMSLSEQTAAAASQAGGDAQGSLQQLASALESFSNQL